MNIYDICVIIFVVLIIVWSNRSGFINVAYRLFSFVIAIFIALNLYPYIAAFLRMTPIYPGLCNKYSGMFLNMLNDTSSGKQIPIKTAVKKLNLPDFVSNLLIDKNSSKPAADTINNVSQSLGEGVAKLVVDLLAVIVLFLIIIILLFILKQILLTLVKMPVIKTGNRIMGTLFGFFFSILLVYFISGVLDVLSATFMWETTYNMLHNAALSPYFIEGNMIVSVFA